MGLTKRDEFLPLSRPEISEAEIKAVTACLRSGWITTGPRTAEFEKAFAQRVDAPQAVAVSSATAGLHLLLHALGIGPGDEVITSPFTFASTVNMIALLGAKPVFADIDYHSLMMRPELVREKITEKTRAIIPVHIAGAPFDLDPLCELAREKGIKVVDDAAHALGVVYKGRPVGSHPHPAVFSFQATKNITSAEGGMITLHDQELAARLRRLRFHGLERASAWERETQGRGPHYDIHDPGFKYNLPDVLSALGMVQLERLDEINGRRRRLAEAYLVGLEGVDGLDLPFRGKEGEVHGWHLFIIKVKSMPREEFMFRLKEYNIGTGLHFPPCHLLSYVQERYGYKQGDFPECEKAAKRIVSLPLFPGMSEEDVEYVCAAVKEVLEG